MGLEEALVKLLEFGTSDCACVLVSPSDVEGCWNEEKALNPITWGDLKSKKASEFGSSDYEDLHS
jgi:hypothetical protein